jgi:hypothetical protein
VIDPGQQALAGLRVALARKLVYQVVGQAVYFDYDYALNLGWYVNWQREEKD